MIPNSKKVLIVDDCHEDNYLLQQALRGCGVEHIETLTSGGEAAKFVAGLPPHQFREMPDLIFADINMQGVDGLHLIRWLRRDPIFKDIPIIVLSGSANPQHQTDALASACCLGRMNRRLEMGAALNPRAGRLLASAVC